MTRPRPKGRWITWALIVSLAVNVAVVAAVIGAVATGGPDRHGPRDEARRGGGPPEIAALARGLEPQDRRTLFRALRENGRLAGGREAMRDARGDIADTLRADPYDPDAFEAAMQAQRTLQAELSGRGITVLSDVLAGLTTAERVALAERLERRTR